MIQSSATFESEVLHNYCHQLYNSHIFKSIADFEMKGFASSAGLKPKRG